LRTENWRGWWGELGDVDVKADISGRIDADVRGGII
jgi:hypothetical protein